MHKFEFKRRMSLIDEMTENILKKGIIKDKNQAETIARRWVKYN